MTAEKIMNLLWKLKVAGDVTFDRLDDEVYVTIRDFIGFTDEGDEKFRAYNAPELVEFLEDVMDIYGDGFSMTFDNITFEIDYASDDI